MTELEEVIKTVLFDTDVYASISDDNIEFLSEIFTNTIMDSTVDVNKNSECFNLFAEKAEEEIGFENDIDWAEIGQMIYEEIS